MRFLLLLPLILLLFSCSSKTPPYEWRSHSASAFASYTQSFLRDDALGSKSNLTMAIQHAKSSAKLEQLASIYLGKCALDRAVGIKSNCREYQKIANFIHSPTLFSYYSLLKGRLTSSQINALPPQYQSFAHSYTNANYPQAFEAIMQIKKPTSQLIASSLIQKHLNNHQRDQILLIASKYGYKRAVIFWLEEQLNYTQNSAKKNQIKEKIKILQN